jgi:2-methylcitrate dehydratase PrpD
VLAACLALAEKSQSSGSDLLTAYIVGVEIACRLGDAVDPSHYLEGFHPTGTLGAFGAAAACCHLMGLEIERIRCAFGIAGTLASGLRANRGTMAKALNAGRAAENGVIAAALAARDFTASPEIFEDRMGFFQAASRNRFAPDALGLGSPFFFENPGIAIKRYPCPIVMHPALDVVLELVQRHDIRPETVAGLRVHLHPTSALPLVHPDPETGLQGKFSLPFTIALAVADRRVTLDQYNDRRVRDPHIHALMQRVELVPDHRLKPVGTLGASAEVELISTTGPTYRQGATVARGHPTKPLDRSALTEKFYRCLQQAPAGLARQADGFLAGLWSIEHLTSVPEWLQRLRAGRS